MQEHQKIGNGDTFDREKLQSLAAAPDCLDTPDWFPAGVGIVGNDIEGPVRCVMSHTQAGAFQGLTGLHHLPAREDSRPRPIFLLTASEREFVSSTIPIGKGFGRAVGHSICGSCHSIQRSDAS